MTTTHVSMNGIIGGHIWMPNAFCAKNFSLSEDDFRYSDCSRPSIRDMVLEATNDGDFQSTSIIEATVVFKRVRTLPNGETITRKREMDIRLFKSVDDCVVKEDSEEYWKGIDAMNAEFEEEFEEE